MNNLEFQEINSLENRQIKILKKLALKRYRKELNLFTVENFVIIKDAFSSGYVFESLFIEKNFFLKHESDLRLMIKNSKIKDIYLIDEKLNKSFSQLETPSGITAVYRIEKRNLTKSSVIYLNAISDPGNMGSIMRSALAFGFKNIVLDDACVDLYNQKTISSAKDSIFKLNIIFDKDLKFLKESKLPIYASVASSKGKNLKSINLKSDICLVLGSESHGVCQEIIKLSQDTLNIKISKEIESLNVSIAASIIFYELSQLNKD